MPDPELVKTWSGDGYLQVMACDNYKNSEAFIVIYSYRSLSDSTVRNGRLAYRLKKDENVFKTDLGEINAASCHINYPYMVYTYRSAPTGTVNDNEQEGRTVGVINMTTGDHTVHPESNLQITDTSLFNFSPVTRTRALAGIGVLKIKTTEFTEERTDK